MNLPNKNDIIELEITAISNEGSGIGRYEGVVVFVPATVPGDIINAKVVKVLKNRIYAIVDKIIKPADDRIENDCPVYPRCGGCTLRHMSYSKELEEKAGFLKGNLEKIGKVFIENESIIPSPKTERYRNLAQYPVQLVEGKPKVGFYAPRSHRLIPLEDCLLQPKVYSNISNIICDYIEKENISVYDEETRKGLVRHICLRSSKDCEEVMVTVVINGKTFPKWEGLIKELRDVCPNLRTFILNHNMKNTNVIMGNKETILYGDGIIIDTLCGVELEISSKSFYQVNRDSAELLYAKALEYAKPQKHEILLDLYCGIGAIGLSMAGYVSEVIGVEIVEDAIINAEKNSKINDILNARFICADAGKAAQKLSKEGTKPNIVVLDPPRKGIDKATLDAVCEMTPERVVYVSCNTATLARDVNLFEEKGYKVMKATAVDLFPRTSHVESVVLLEKE